SPSTQRHATFVRSAVLAKSFREDDKSTCGPLRSQTSSTQVIGSFYLFGSEHVYFSFRVSTRRPLRDPNSTRMLQQRPNRTRIRSPAAGPATVSLEAASAIRTPRARN